MAEQTFGHKFQHQIGRDRIAPVPLNQMFSVVDVVTTHKPSGAENAVERTGIKDSIAIAATGDSTQNWMLQFVTAVRAKFNHQIYLCGS